MNQLKKVKVKKNKQQTVLKHDEKPRPPSKLSHAPSTVAHNAIHREIRQSEDDNVGVESAHKLEETAESSIHTVRSAHRSHQLRAHRNASRAEVCADKAKASQFSSNPYSKWQQKRAIKREYITARSGKTTQNAAKASKSATKAARRAAKESKQASSFVVRHRKGLLIVGGLAIVIVLLLNMMSSCSMMFQSAASGVVLSTYPSKDTDMLVAEEQYHGMEIELQQKLDNYETEHDYDEYYYDLDTIEHDPYVLISILTALQGGEWTIADVQADLAMLFEKQYILAESVTVEVRYRMETRIQADGSIYTVQVPYNYYICTVTLENFNLSHLPVYIMGEDQMSMYATYMATLGNRPDLFTTSTYIPKYITNPPAEYEVPAPYLQDEQFARLIEEAEKYLNFPYVWGGSNPNTSFDCSGFVSYVLTNSGLYNTGRLGAQGLYDISRRVSTPRPGDLVFFTGTYDTPGVSHVGIYVGDGMMLHCGDPIQYSSLNTSYWQSHFYAYGRLNYN